METLTSISENFRKYVSHKFAEKNIDFLLSFNPQEMDFFSLLEFTSIPSADAKEIHTFVKYRDFEGVMGINIEREFVFFAKSWAKENLFLENTRAQELFYAFLKESGTIQKIQTWN